MLLNVECSVFVFFGFVDSNLLSGKGDGFIIFYNKSKEFVLSFGLLKYCIKSFLVKDELINVCYR